jgi:hypothetical protein
MATPKRNHAEVIQKALMASLGKEPRKFDGVFLGAYPKMQKELGPGGGEEMMRLRAYEQLQNLHENGRITRVRVCGFTIYQAVEKSKKRKKRNL